LEDQKIGRLEGEEIRGLDRKDISLRSIRTGYWNLLSTRQRPIGKKRPSALSAEGLYRRSLDVPSHYLSEKSCLLMDAMLYFL
jgi:hypothetical protein